MSSIKVGSKIQSPNSGDLYTLLQKCGHGSFGVVYKARPTKSQALVAVKLVDVSSMQEDVDMIIREVSLTEKAHTISAGRCPKFFEAFALKIEDKNGRSKQYIVIVIEYIEGVSVANLFQDDRPLSETFALHITHEVAACLQSLHLEGFIHRDVKSSNVLVSKSGEVYLCDFGVAKILSAPSTSTLSGTPFWMAPEMIAGEQYNSAVDIYSLGITAVEMVTGAPPIAKGISPTTDAHMMIAELKKVGGVDPGLDQTIFSRFFRDIVAGCLKSDPTTRFSAQEVVGRIKKHCCPTEKSAHAGSGSISSNRSISTLMMGSFNPKLALGALVTAHLNSKHKSH
jgi:serine/threonine-protein kinase 24/25/MST4